MTTTNGGPAQVGSTPGAGQEQPQLTVVGQYIKDFSFENPNAPQSLNVRQEQPQIGIQINVAATPLSETDIEVVVKLDGKAETTSMMLFRFELEFAGIFRIRNVPQESLNPIVMVAGQATPDQAPARLFAHRDPESFLRLIDCLVDTSIEYLAKQLQAGADCVQIFDTWAGVLGPEQFDRWCIAPTQRIVEGVRRRIPRARIIGFPRGAGAMALPYVEMTGVNAIGIDWTFERAIARDALQSRVPVQGNVDPLALLAGGAALDREVDDVLRHLGDGPLIFNLGHERRCEEVALREPSVI